MSVSNNSINGSLPEAWADGAWGGGGTRLIVDLSINSIQGTLPSSWWKLPICELYLYLNSLSGQLPAAWGDGSWCLQPSSFTPAAADIVHDPTASLPGGFRYSGTAALTLALFQNAFTGQLPDSWGQGPWRNAADAKINLGHNSLAGSLPPSWAALPISELYLDTNKIQSSLPNWSHASWGRVTGVIFYAFSNELYGSLPTGWSAIAFSELKLGNNRLTSSLPPEWGKGCWGRYSGLTLLLYANLLTGTVPSEWGLGCWVDAVDITINLGENALTGSVPITWGGLSISQLYMYDCYLNGTLPAAASMANWGRSSRLILSLHSNQLSSTLPSDWVTVPFKDLYLAANLLNGTLPAAWADACWGDDSGMTLYLYANQFTGPLPIAWGYGPCWLEAPDIAIGLDNNSLTGQLPPAWSHLQITVLYLDFNSFSGGLPEAWANASWGVSNPLMINLAYNSLTGPLPLSWASLNFTFLKISRNMLTGTLHSEWDEAVWINNTNLTLDVQNNGISGKLPSTWSAINFTELYMGSNNMTGSIPPEYGCCGGWIGMTALGLDNLALTGQRPEAHCQLPVRCAHSPPALYA